MGKVGVPAQQAGTGGGGGQRSSQHRLVLQLQAAAAPSQIVVAHPQSAWPHHKTHEAGAIAAAADLGFHRMGSQPQGRQLGLQPAAGALQWLGVVGKQGQIIHVAQLGAHARQGAERVIKRIEVQIGQELAG